MLGWPWLTSDSRRMILLGEDDFADSQWMPAGPFAVDTVVTKNVTLSLMFELRGYIDENGKKRFALLVRAAECHRRRQGDDRPYAHGAG